MRIINNPNPTPEITKVCKHCGCAFAFYDREVINNAHIINDGIYKEWVYCPNCGKTLILFDSSKNSPMSFDDLEGNWYSKI